MVSFASFSRYGTSHSAVSTGSGRAVWQASRWASASRAAMSPTSPSESSILPYARPRLWRASRATSTASADQPLAVSPRSAVTASAACLP